MNLTQSPTQADRNLRTHQRYPESGTNTHITENNDMQAQGSENSGILSAQSQHAVTSPLNQTSREGSWWLLHGGSGPGETDHAELPCGSLSLYQPSCWWWCPHMVGLHGSYSGIPSSWCQKYGNMGIPSWFICISRARWAEGLRIWLTDSMASMSTWSAGWQLHMSCNVPWRALARSWQGQEAVVLQEGHQGTRADIYPGRSSWIYTIAATAWTVKHRWPADILRQLHGANARTLLAARWQWTSWSNPPIWDTTGASWPSEDADPGSLNPGTRRSWVQFW